MSKSKQKRASVFWPVVALVLGIIVVANIEKLLPALMVLAFLALIYRMFIGRRR